MIAFACWSDLGLGSKHSAPQILMIPTQMLGLIGMQDMILFIVVLLLLFGAKKLPELARGLGKTMGEFKKAREESDEEIARTRSEADAKPKDPAAK